MLSVPNTVNLAPYCVQLSDVNNDKNLDVVTSNAGSDGGLFVFLGYGNGSFHEPLLTSYSGDFPDFLTIEDLNDDRQLDIVSVSSQSVQIHVLLGQGDGTFEIVSKYFHPGRTQLTRATLGYYNDDSFLDMAVGLTSDASIHIYLGMGNGSFEPPIRLPTGEYSFPRFVIFADFNNDNQQDIVVGDQAINNILIFFVRSIIDFTHETNYTTGTSPHPVFIRISDLNNDRQSDLIVANSGTDEIEILNNYSRDVFMNRTILSTGLGSHPRSLAIADFNRDHFLDIAVVNTWTSNVNIFLRQNDGSFPTRLVYPTATDSAPISIDVADLNNDGRLDIVTVNEYTDSVAVFLSSNYVSFVSDVIKTPDPNSQLTCIKTADFNNDQLMDIVVGDTNSNILGIYFSYGNGTFSEQMTISLESGPALDSLAVGDFNNDNHLDIAILILESIDLVIYLGYGNGSFALPKSYETDFALMPNLLATADFNRDDKLDVVLAGARGTDGGGVWVFFGHGNGSFQRELIYSINNELYTAWVVVDDLKVIRIQISFFSIVKLTSSAYSLDMAMVVLET